MNYLAVMAFKSACNRRFTLGLLLICIMLSVVMLLGIERVRHHLRASFTESVSGTDLIVGPRGSAMQLLLQAVFRLGEPTTSNMRWESFQRIAKHPAVASAIPLAFGDTLHGFPVMGTSVEYFEYFRYGAEHRLAFAEGKPFDQVFGAVLGADVAASLHYRLGDKVTAQHGAGELMHAEHDDKPLTIVGILQPTGTPVDRTVHISLDTLSALHLDWQGGSKMAGFSIPAEYVRKFNLRPRFISAALVSLKSRTSVFVVQQFINEQGADPLLAVLPSVALDQLWQVIGVVEKVLLGLSVVIMLVALAGLVAVILTGLNERRRELAVLRSVGAGALHILVLLALESAFITLFGAVLGVGMLDAATALCGPWLQVNYSLPIPAGLIYQNEMPLLLLVIAVGIVAGLGPGYRAYRLSLVDGITPRL